MTTIVRYHSEDPFARIPKALLDDTRLSWKAKGILCYLLGKPDDWRAWVSDIQAHGGDGESAIKSGLSELRKIGYAKLERITDRGRVSAWILHISDAPTFADQEKSKPEVENPLVENPQVENRPLSKNEGSKNEGTKNEEEGENAGCAGRAAGAAPPPEATPEKDPSKPVKRSRGPRRPREKKIDPESAARLIAFNRFVAQWFEAYKKHTGMPYVPNRIQDFAAAKRITSNGRSVDELIELARFSWVPGNLDRFYAQQAQTIAGFASRLSNIQSAFVAKHGRKLTEEERSANVAAGQEWKNASF